MTERPSLTVLLSLAPPDGKTKYVDQLVDGAPDEVTLHFFTWREALTGKYDAFHVHWPELTIRAKSPVKRFLRRRAADLLFLRLKLMRRPLVRTLHNVEPHEAGDRPERRSLARYDRATTLFIRLNTTTSIDARGEVVTILHGHYRDEFKRHPLPAITPGRILYFGIIRPYKNVPGLITAFRAIDDPSLSLRVVGSPSVGMREQVEAAAAGDDRVSSRLAFVDDDELVSEIGQAELVVLPYSEMHNSGAILVAMSLARPVLAPATPANLALQDEVGQEWVLLYSGELTATTLTDALHTVRSTPRSGEPPLDGRDWLRLGEEHYAAYRRAIAAAKA